MFQINGTVALLKKTLKKHPKEPTNPKQNSKLDNLMLVRTKLFAFSGANQLHKQRDRDHFYLTIFRKVICAVFLIDGDYKCFCVEKVMKADFNTSESH